MEVPLPSLLPVTVLLLTILLRLPSAGWSRILRRAEDLSTKRIVSARRFVSIC